MLRKAPQKFPLALLLVDAPAGAEPNRIVSTNDAGKDTLADIQAQLSNSISVKDVITTKFAGRDALKFTATGYGSGVVFIANGKVYYLLGQDKYFSALTLI